MALLRSRRLVLQILLTLALLALVIWRIDFLEALRRLRTIDGGWVAVALAMMVSSHFLHALRWWLFLPHRAAVPLFDATRIHVISRLLDTSLSTISGDVLRIEILNRRYQIARGEATAAVLVIESILDWTAQITLIVVALVFFTIPGVTAQAVAILALLTFAGAVGAWMIARVDPNHDITAHRPLSWLPLAVRQFVPQLIKGLVTLRRPGELLRSVFITAAIFVVDVLMFWAFGQALGLSLWLHQYFIVLIAVSALQSVPLTPGYLGSYELVVTAVLALQGADSALAGSFAVSSHLFTLAWTGILAVLSWVSLGISPRQFLKE